MTEAKGISFARLAIAMAVGGEDHQTAARIAARRWGEKSLAHEVLTRGGPQFLLEKANIPAGSTQSGGWAEILVNFEGAAAEFFSLTRERSLLGRIPGLRRVPLRTRLIGVASGFSAAWIGEGQAKPVSKGTFTQETLVGRKVSSLTVVTDELLDSADPASETVIRDDMVRALAATIDESFINPANAGTANIEPASIAYGAAVDAATGTSTDDIRDSLAFAIGQFDGDLTRAVLVGRPELFAHMGLQSAFQIEQLGARGGSIGGIPAIASTALPLDASGKQQLILLDPDSVAFGEEGMDLRTSRKGTIQMADNPTGSSTDPTGTASVISLWQCNSSGILAEKTISWQLARSGGVRVIAGLVGGTAS